MYGINSFLVRDGEKEKGGGDEREKGDSLLVFFLTLTDWTEPLDLS